MDGGTKSADAMQSGQWKSSLTSPPGAGAWGAPPDCVQMKLGIPALFGFAADTSGHNAANAMAKMAASATNRRDMADGILQEPPRRAIYSIGSRPIAATAAAGMTKPGAFSGRDDKARRVQSPG